MGIGQIDERQDKTHARILEVALELIAKQGFAATSTREISERLGFTKAALYYHFRTKDELLTAIVAPAMAHLSGVVEGKSALPAASPRRELLASYVDLVATHEELIRVLSEDPSVANRPALLAAGPLYECLTQLLSGRAGYLAPCPGTRGPRGHSCSDPACTC
jgi:AcrR family transcriptional regulator